MSRLLVSVRHAGRIQLNVENVGGTELFGRRDKFCKTPLQSILRSRSVYLDERIYVNIYGIWGRVHLGAV